MSIWSGLALLVGWFFAFGVWQIGDTVAVVSRGYLPDFQLAAITQSFKGESQLNFNDLKGYIDQVVVASASEGRLADPVRLTMVGDIMLDRGVRQVVENSGGGYGMLFDQVGWIKESDILFGNLEGPISGVGEDLGGQYSFRMDPAVTKVLSEAGFDVLSVANNHMGDWGRDAFVDTLSRLRTFGILSPGAGLNQVQAEQPQIIEKNGIKFGFLGFSDVGPNWLEVSEGEAGILLASNPRLPQIVEVASQQVDVLIVSFHFGEEYQDKANERQISLAETAIANGAKLVVGHHPHVVQEVVEHEGGLIAYSLGNFIFDQNFSEATMQGAVLEVEFVGPEIAWWQVKTVKLNDQYIPSLVQ